MSRREYPVADLYEERERDVYRNGRRTQTREYYDLDEDIRTTRTPDFLRDNYGRSSNAGELVVRGSRRDDRTEVDVDTRSYAKSARGSPPRRREVETEQIIIRDDRASRARDDFSSRRSVPDLRSRPRTVEKDDIDIDIRHSDARSVRSSRPREVEREEIDIDIRRREDDARSVRSRRPREVEETDIDIDIRRRESDARSVRSSRPREVEREEFSIRRAETERGPARSRMPDESEFVVRRGEGPRPPPPGAFEKSHIDIDIDRERRDARGRLVEKDEVDIDIRSKSRGRVRSPSRERARVVIRESSRGPPRERSMPPPNLMRRDTEEFVIRRRRPSPSPSPSPPPPPPARETRQEIIIRRTEQRSPTPPPPPPPPEPELPPPPVLAPIVRPPIHQEIHQEIITHHRHIDHGVERARSPSPLPPPPPPPPAPVEEKQETLEIDIRHERGARFHEDEIEIRQTRGRSASRSRSLDAPLTRRGHYYDDELEAEAEFYNRKALERSYPGEAYNGATRDWGLVDVPPGTERVRMDGAGGGAQEITWGRYNGTRRSKFITPDGREFAKGHGERAPIDSGDRRVGPVRQKPADMWTEVTKDLVIKEAIEHLGYEYEETEGFWYVMEYLRYEDVLQLVEVSDEIRSARRRRIREIEWERSALDSHRSARDDGRFYEREIVIDKRERRY